MSAKKPSRSTQKSSRPARAAKPKARKTKKDPFDWLLAPGRAMKRFSDAFTVDPRKLR